MSLAEHSGRRNFGGKQKGKLFHSTEVSFSTYRFHFGKDHMYSSWQNPIYKIDFFFLWQPDDIPQNPEMIRECNSLDKHMGSSQGLEFAG